ncbi:MAG: hypothetical protein J0H88_08385 [Sphingomonadales bacterium]|nr:hypothetical protein [Sphingomonadales bacterium]
MRLEVSERDLAAAADDIIRDVLRELRDAVEEETRGLEKDLEGITRMAVPGRLWRAWTSETFPKGGRIARVPEGEVYVKGGDRSQGAMTFHTDSGRIRSRDGQYLAIPTKAAGGRGRGRNLTPGEWEKITGQRLEFVYTKRKFALLVASGVTNARTGRYRQATPRRAAGDARRGKVREAKPIVIFVLVPFVNFKPSFSVEHQLQRRQASLAARVGRIARQ